MRPRRLVLALAVALTACGDDEADPAEEREAQIVQLAQDLQVETGGALDDDQSACVATALVDAVGVDRFDDVVEAAGDAGDPDLRDEIIDVFAGCDALEPIADG